MDEQPIPAATVVVFREGKGAPELLMVERSAALRFAGGKLVFPGGRLDPGDLLLAQGLDGDPDDMAARIAAIREAIEETGVGVGIEAAQDDLAAIRARLHAGATLAAAIEGTGAVLRPETLVPFARWLPHGVQHRVFDTRFYLARAPTDAVPTPDGGENVRAFWARAREVLAAADMGEAAIIFPTRRNLERLARFRTFADAVADARAHPVRTVTPWVERRDGIEHLCIPDDLGYPVTSEPLTAATRG